MPLAEIYFNPERISPVVVREVAKRLPYFVAETLSVQEGDGHLVSSDIEVRVRTKGPHDITAYDLEITVWAKHYREREDRLVDAVKRIAHLVHLTTRGDCKGFVYILLAPAGFAEFGSQES